MQRAVQKGLKVPCLFMITEVSIRCQKKPGGWYTLYTRVYPQYTTVHNCVLLTLPAQYAEGVRLSVRPSVPSIDS